MQDTFNLKEFCLRLSNKIDLPISLSPVLFGAALEEGPAAGAAAGCQNIKMAITATCPMLSVLQQDRGRTAMRHDQSQERHALFQTFSLLSMKAFWISLLQTAKILSFFVNSKIYK